MIVRGVRARLVLTVIGLVSLTAFVLGVGSYAYVASSLRDQQLQAARDLTDYNVAVLAAARLPERATRTDLQNSHLLDGFASRGIAGTIVDFGDGDPYASDLDAAAAADLLSPELRRVVSAGEIGYQRVDRAAGPLLVLGARRPPAGPDFYFLFDSTAVEEAIGQLGRALLVGGVILVLVAALVAGAVARTILRPVRDAAGAAEQIAGGDLSARLDASADDEFGRWAVSFNRMAAALEDHVGRLRAAQAREQRFVADVSHELRTPLTALVGEASLLRGHLEALPALPRRAGELLLADVARLRALVDDLMEISRFDAGAETAAADPVDLRALVRANVEARLPSAKVTFGAGGSHPGGPDMVVVTDGRRLERVLGNLLDNARVHGEGREVRVEVGLEDGAAGDADGSEAPAAVGLDGVVAGAAAADGGTGPTAGMRPARLVVSVSDRGPGVEPAELPHLFDRFHKADPSRHLGGSGLGLAVAREHAAILGGTLEAALRPGGGMRFVLVVPVTRPLHDGDGPVTVEGDAGALVGTRTESLS